MTTTPMNTTMTHDCKTCHVSTGTHKPAEALHQIDEPLAEALLELAAYRFTVENREARIAELEGQLEAIGAGGVEPLHKQVAPQAVQAAVPDAPIGQTGKYKSGDRIVCTNAVNAKFITEGREYVAGIMGRNPGGVFVVADDGEESEYRADRFIAAPAHPAEGVPAQCPNINEPCGCWRVACQLGGKCREPERSATQPAAHGMDVVQAAKALCKHAAKVQNVNFDDYWLIHAEEFKEEVQIVLDAAQAKQGE